MHVCSPRAWPTISASLSSSIIAPAPTAIKGFGQTTQAVLGGEVQLAFITLQAAKGMLTAGRVRVLALGEEARPEAMPGVPALSEFLPGFKM